MEVAVNNYRDNYTEEVGKRMINAKPFLKWAGGKTQLIEEIEKRLPDGIREGKIECYVEPFIGSGALFFYLVAKYKFKRVIINDINSELINVYLVIKNEVENLIEELEKISKKYFSILQEEKSLFFYEIREKYNINKEGNIKHAAYFIFLNRTCFNGLYRVNSKGKFNVPFGRYVNPKICDVENLKNVSKILKNVEILNIDFEKTDKYIKKESFIYFDPPYRPLSNSSSFNSYAKESFNDKSQEKLAQYFRRLDKKGVKLMLSNSDPKNSDPNDNFFDDLYKGFDIKRVDAKRMINSKGSGRGVIKELLIMNY